MGFLFTFFFLALLFMWSYYVSVLGGGTTGPYYLLSVMTGIQPYTYPLEHYRILECYSSKGLRNI